RHAVARRKPSEGGQDSAYGALRRFQLSASSSRLPARIARMKILACALFLLVLGSLADAQQVATPASRAVVVRAGRLIDPAAGTAAANQTIVIQNGRITAIGASPQIPPNAEVIDLSRLTVLPGLVDAHNHLALTYKMDPESNVYYLTYVMDSTA